MNSSSISVEGLSRPGNVDLSSWFSLVDLFSAICFVVVDDTKFTLTTSWLVKLWGFEFNSITFNTSVPTLFPEIFLETWDIVWYFSWGVDTSLFYRIIDFATTLWLKQNFQSYRATFDASNSTFLYLMFETATAFIRRIRFYIYKVIDDFTILITTMGSSTELSTWHMGVTWKFSPSVMIFSRTTMVPATMRQIIFASDTILIFTARNNFTKTNSTICQSWAEIEELSCLIICKIWCNPFYLFIFYIRSLDTLVPFV